MNSERLQISPFVSLQEPPPAHIYSSLYRDNKFSYPMHIRKLFDMEQTVCDFFFEHELDGQKVRNFINNRVGEYKALILEPLTARSLNRGMWRSSGERKLPTAPDMYIFSHEYKSDTLKLEGAIEICCAEVRFRDKVPKLQLFFNQLRNPSSSYMRGMNDVVSKSALADKCVLSDNPFAMFLCTRPYSTSAIKAWWNKFEQQRSVTDVPFDVIVEGADIFWLNK